MGAILAQPDHLLALVGVTGGTGARAVLGLLDVGFAPSQLRVLSRSPLQPSCEALAAIGVQVVHADLDDEDSLPQALQGVTAVYCHSTVGDTAKLETAEVERARTLAAAAAACGTVKLLVYNSAATTNKCPRVDRSRQKQDAEEVFRSQPGLPCTMLRATLFMEEFWKKYGDASVCLRSPMVATSTALPVCSNWGRCASSRAHTHSPRHDRVSSKGTPGQASLKKASFHSPSHRQLPSTWLLSGIWAGWLELASAPQRRLPGESSMSRPTSERPSRWHCLYPHASITTHL